MTRKRIQRQVEGLGWPGPWWALLVSSGQGSLEPHFPCRHSRLLCGLLLLVSVRDV